MAVKQAITVGNMKEILQHAEMQLMGATVLGLFLGGTEEEVQRAKVLLDGTRELLQAIEDNMRIAILYPEDN